MCHICLKYNVLIVSDEIFADIVFTPHKHIVAASLSEEIANNTITISSPSKGFNLAGLMVSNYIISNE